MTRLLIATILFFVFQSKTSVLTIEIKSVSKEILTYAQVDCSRFEDSFEKNEMKRRTIRGKGKVNNFMSELDKLEMQDRKNGTDTRAVITIKYFDHTETICADKFSIYRNGTCYKITDKLKKLIW